MNGSVSRILLSGVFAGLSLVSQLETGTDAGHFVLSLYCPRIFILFYFFGRYCLLLVHLRMSVVKRYV